MKQPAVERRLETTRERERMTCSRGQRETGGIKHTAALFSCRQAAVIMVRGSGLWLCHSLSLSRMDLQFHICVTWCTTVGEEAQWEVCCLLSYCMLQFGAKDGYISQHQHQHCIQHCGPVLCNVVTIWTTEGSSTLSSVTQTPSNSRDASWEQLSDGWMASDSSFFTPFFSASDRFSNFPKTTVGCSAHFKQWQGSCAELREEPGFKHLPKNVRCHLCFFKMTNTASPSQHILLVCISFHFSVKQNKDQVILSSIHNHCDTAFCFFPNGWQGRKHVITWLFTL